MSFSGPGKTKSDAEMSSDASSWSSFEDEQDPGIFAEINITPLTDIFLVLLIIFMVTSSVMNQMGVQVQLPKSKEAASSTTTNKPTLVSVSSDGRIMVNGKQVQSSSLSEAMKASLEKSSDKTVILEGDKQAVLGTVVQIMDEGKKAGAQKFAIATSSQ